MAKKNSVEIVLAAQDQASKEIQKAIRKTNTEFNSLNKSLKKIGVDSKEIDKIDQKIKEANPEILENELENVRHKLRKLGMDASEIEKITKELREAKEEGQKVESESLDIGRGLDVAALGAGGLAAAVGGAVLKLGKFKADLHDINLTFEAATGASGEALEDLENSFNSLYLSARGTQEEITEALIFVKRSFKDLDGKELENVTNKALILKEAIKVDVSESLRAVKVLMKNFGITADEAFDLIVQGAFNGLDESNDLMDTLIEYSPQFKKMGYSADEFFQVLNNGMDKGARNTDLVADTVKEFNIRLKEGSDKTQKALQILYGKEYPALKKELESTGGIGKDVMEVIIQKLKSVKNETDRNNIGLDLFGTKWEDMQEDAVLALTNTEGKLQNVEGATERAADALDNKLSKSWRIFWNNFKMDITSIPEDRGSLGIAKLLKESERDFDVFEEEVKENLKSVQKSHSEMANLIAEEDEFIRLVKQRTKDDIVSTDQEIVSSNDSIISSNAKVTQSYVETKDAVEEYKDLLLDTVDFQQTELNKAFEIRLAQLGNEVDAQHKVTLELQHYEEELKLIEQEMALLEEKYDLSKKIKGEDAEATRQLKLEIMNLQLEQAKLKNETDAATQSINDQAQAEWEAQSQKAIKFAENNPDYDGDRARYIEKAVKNNEVITNEGYEQYKNNLEEEATRIANEQGVDMGVALDMAKTNIDIGEQRYHTIGRVSKYGPKPLAPDEVPIIAREGELYADESKMAKVPDALLAGAGSGFYAPINLNFNFNGSNVFSDSKNQFKRFIQTEVVPIVSREIGKTVMKRKKI